MQNVNLLLWTKNYSSVTGSSKPHQKKLCFFAFIVVTAIGPKQPPSYASKRAHTEPYTMFPIKVGWEGALNLPSPQNC